MVNLPIEYSDKPVSAFGGMSLLKRMLDKVGITEQLDGRRFLFQDQTGGYSPHKLILSFWLGIWTGASRYIHCDWLRYGKVLQDIFGLDRMP